MPRPYLAHEVIQLRSVHRGLSAHGDDSISDTALLLLKGLSSQGVTGEDVLPGLQTAGNQSPGVAGGLSSVEGMTIDSHQTVKPHVLGERAPLLSFFPSPVLNSTPFQISPRCL